MKLTDFEKKVYRVVSKIPLGEARSYRWVAAKAGRPRAYRAVGNALNKNPFAPYVPCHRVVRSDGSLGGFARGAAAKNKLLRREKEIAKIIKLVI
ncbi:MAG: MGMT family protein [Candidatus Omnitrophica bacterium]|nr:MGMT family protein [Candidatus Omnitrophota bacterium]